MKKYTVIYEGGQSRYCAESVDYMLVNVEGVELYAEMPAKEDDYNYFILRDIIIEQARDNDVDPNELVFWWD